MPKVTIVDYQAAQDLTRDEAVRWRFTLPENFVQGTGQAIPVLFFRVDATKDNTCYVHVNSAADNPTHDNAAIRLGVRGDHGHKTLHELLSGTTFTPGSENQILISRGRDNRNGDFYVSDIVLMYQVAIYV